jgi:hypothetical protein
MNAQERTLNSLTREREREREREASVGVKMMLEFSSLKYASFRPLPARKDKRRTKVKRELNVRIIMNHRVPEFHLDLMSRVQPFAT